MSNVVSYINPERHGRCYACGKDMPIGAMEPFDLDVDVTEFLCRDWESCGARVLGTRERDLLTTHAAAVAGKLAQDVKAVLRASRDGRTVTGPTPAEVAARVEHVARVLRLYNSKDNVVRPAWASERQVAIPSAGAWRDLVHRVNALESWANNTSDYLAGPMARTEPVPTVYADDDAATETFPKIVP